LKQYNRAEKELELIYIYIYTYKQTSPRESIQDIKQSIMESPDTCANSCFYLALNGKRINDYLELGEVEGITPESEIELIEGNACQYYFSDYG
jgi:hypothetical protein